MSNLVDQPILNDAYLEPTRHWHIEAGREPELRESRRPAQYVVARAERKGGAAQLLHEAVALDAVNRVRERVKAWREAGYPGVTRVTRELLAHWNPAVESYARNYRLGFEIPYDFGGQTHPYTPDFIVRLKQPDGSKVHVVLEVKGLEGNQDRAKEAGAKRWVEAVNNWGELGQWGYAVVKDLTETEEVLNRFCQARSPEPVVINA